jgi:hypothetical protein
MKTIKVKANRRLLHDQLGTIRKGDEVKLPEALAKEYLERGWVGEYETKVIEEKPKNKKGPVEGELTVDVPAPASIK